MKKSILFLLMLLLSIVMVSGIVYKYQIQTTPTSYNSTFSDYNSGWGKQSYINITDGSYTTFAETEVNVSRLYINYTDWVESTNASIIEITANRSGIVDRYNYTSGPCFNVNNTGQSQVLVISNNTQNFSNSVTNEVFTWINDTAVNLTHTRIITSVIVFNTSGGVIESGNYTINYLNGSIVLTSNFHNNTINYINYTYTTDDVPRIRTFCRDSATTWTSLYSTDGSDEIYDVRVYWYIPAKDYTFSYTLIRPDEYTTSTSTSVDFNLTGNWTGSLTTTTINCSLYTRWNNTMGYAINSTGYVLINKSYVNTTRLFGDKGRYWWFWNCEDNNSREIQNTTARIFDVDTTYSQLSIGVNQVINMSITTGNIVTMGSLIAGTSITAGGLGTFNDLKLINLTTYTACDDTQNGRIVYNASEHWLMFCNSTNWIRTS